MRETDNKEVNDQIYKFQMLTNTITEQSRGLQRPRGGVVGPVREDQFLSRGE